MQNLLSLLTTLLLYDLSLVSSERSSLIQEQQTDESLVDAFKLARRNKGNENDLLYRKEFMCGKQLLNLVVPTLRRLPV